MIEPPPDVKKRLLFIMQRAWSEVRDLAGAGQFSQLLALADAVHEIPHNIRCWKNGDLDVIRRNLTVYMKKYPSAARFQYLEFLDQFDVPDN
jgi:hypothetical protein